MLNRTIAVVSALLVGAMGTYGAHAQLPGFGKSGETPEIQKVDFGSLDYSQFERRREIAQQRRTDALQTLADSARAKIRTSQDDFNRAVTPGFSSTDPTAQETLPEGVAVIEDPVTRAYLESVAERLLSNWSGPIPPYEFVVTDGRASGMYADRYGLIYVDAGTLGRVRSEDELAFYVAHELAHILLQHFKGDDIRRRVLNLSTLGFFAANLSVDGNALLDGQQGLDSYIALTGLNVIDNYAANPGWSKKNEYQADRLAADLLILARYSRGGATDAFDEIDAIEVTKRQNIKSACSLRGQVKDGIQTVARFYKENAGRLISGSTLVKFFSDSSPCSAFGSVLRLGKRAKAFGRPSAKKRTERFQDYSNSFYAAVQPVDKTELAGGLLQARLSLSAVALSEVALRSQDALIAGDIDSALRLANQSVPDESEVLYRPRYARFQALKADAIRMNSAADRSKRRNEAIADLQAIVDAGIGPFTTYDTLAYEYVASGDFDKAMQALDAAQQVFGYWTELLPRRIELATQAEQSQEALRYLAVCLEHADRPIKKSCQASANPK